MAVELLVELDLKQIITESGMRLRYEEKQLEAVSMFLRGSDTFVSLPTGYGNGPQYNTVLPRAFNFYTIGRFTFVNEAHVMSRRYHGRC